MARSLYLPVHLHARLVHAPTGKLPRPGDPPFTDGGPGLEPGVHLHWALPDALTRAVVDEPARALRFPALPDFWIVVRFDHAPALTDVPDGPTRRTVTVFHVDAKTGKSGPAGEVAPSDEPAWLTAVGLLPGGVKDTTTDPLPADAPLAAAYYPSARDRFGFHDPLRDLDDVRGLRLSYAVVGAYTVASEDPLARLPDDAARLEWIDAARLDVDLPRPHLLHVPGLHVDLYKPARELEPGALRLRESLVADPRRQVSYPLDRLRELKLAPSRALEATLDALRAADDASHAVAGALAGVDTRVLAPLPEDPTGVPSRLVCHGATVDVGSAGDYADPSGDMRPVAFASIADSASAATEEAFASLGGGELLALLRGGADGELAGVAGRQSLPHLLHAAGFDAASDVPPDPAPDPVGAPRVEYVATIRDSGPLTSLSPKPGTALRVVDRRTVASPPPPGLDAALAALRASPPTGILESQLATLRAAVAPAIVTVEARPVVPPRWYRPGTPVVRLDGHGRAFRHGHDGRMSPDGRLRARLGGQAVSAVVLPGVQGLPGLRLQAAALVDLGPDLRFASGAARELLLEAALLDPSNRGAAASRWLELVPAADRTPALTDAARESFRVTAEHWWRTADPSLPPSAPEPDVGAFTGTPPVPFAVAPWSPPWLPLYAEVEYAFTPHAAPGAALDFREPASPEVRLLAPTPDPAHRVGGVARQLLASDLPDTVASAIRRLRAQYGHAADTDAHLRELVTRLESLDLLTVALTELDPSLRAAGHALRAGELTIPRLRLIDTFGQVRTVAVPARQLPPRLTHWARLQARLVDPTAADADAVRSPHAGTFAFDAVEQALEIFDTAGAPQGQLRQDRQTSAITWEPAPGRTGVALAQLPTPLLRELAALLAQPAPAGQPSALTETLRLLDRARIGVARRLAADDHRAALAGRPVLLLHARLSLELAGVGLGDRPEGQAAHLPGPVPVRLGGLDQSDDALLAFFVKKAGAWRLQVVPAVSTAAWGWNQVVHPLIERSSTLLVTPGTPVDVVLLLDGPSSFHVQAGVLPRKRIDASELFPPRALKPLRLTLAAGPTLIDPSNPRVAAPDLAHDAWTWIERAPPTEPGISDTRELALGAFAPSLTELPERAVTVREGWLRLDPVE